MKFSLYNPNPLRKNVSDCSVRAVAKALDTSWESAYIGLALQGLISGDLPHANRTWGEYLEKFGFIRKLVPDGITVREFSEAHEIGTYVLALSGHVVTVVDGVIYDSWDSENEVVIYFFEKEW